MNKTIAGCLGAALIIGGAAAGTGAASAARQHGTVSSFSSSGSSASWAVEAGSGGNKAIRLSPDADGWAGAYIVHGDGAVLADVPAPSFDLAAETAGASGGSPRLHISLSDGGGLDVRPEAWTGSWQT